MKKYEVIFRVDSSGFNEEEAAESVGEIFDGSKLEAGNALIFMWTRRKTRRAIMFETVINVINSAKDELEAAEKAGEIIEVQKMQPCMSVNLVGVRAIKPENVRGLSSVMCHT